LAVTYQFQFFFTKTFLLCLTKEEFWASLTEANEYDVIFAALKHPLRRRILLLLDEKREVSFTDIQKTVGLEDTGLMSYHLKELALLVSQSARGRYRLSEIGKTSVTLLRKVERAKDMPKVVRKELGRVVGEVLWFLVIAAVPWLAAVSVDIHTSVQLIYSPETSLACVYTLSLLAMYSGVALFTVYYRHYFSKVARKNILHSILFALAVVLPLIPSEYMTYQFIAKTIPTQHSPAETFYGLAMLLRTILFVLGSPFIAHLTCKLAERFFRRKT
jgi:DNA-binding transcriptional ArsR family regulator